VVCGCFWNLEFDRVLGCEVLILIDYLVVIDPGVYLLSDFLGLLYRDT
jgi:hypothetical protein